MLFQDKLVALRAQHTMSQEELAAKIGVSRQAVGKWECGQSSPDIENLTALSALFSISIDRLIKDDDGCNLRPTASVVDTERRETKIGGKDGAPADLLTAFLLDAKKKTYAGKGPESSSCRPQSHDLRYQDGAFLYIDTYLGGELFSGEEAVWYNNVPIWAMNYSGRVTGEHFSGDFLKDALYRVPAAKPFRGPELYADGNYVYHCASTGTLIWYQGNETIYCGNTSIYECVFHGGEIQ